MKNQSKNGDFVSWTAANLAFKDTFKYLTKRKEYKEIIFPLNLLQEDAINDELIGLGRKGRYTMLLEFADNGKISYGDSLIYKVTCS
jgi:hypothetical protein